MSNKIADLYADLSLRSTRFVSGMKDAVNSTRQAGNEMEKALGRGPQKALKETEQETKRVTWAMRGYLKDTARVITGILIAQGFYTLLRAIKDNVAAVWEFTSGVEQAQIQFKYLLGDLRASKGMMLWLQDFAALTPFELTESIHAARMLLAAGFKVNEITPVMQGMVDVTAATGSELGRVAEIFGQIKSEGIITARTLRRLQIMAIPVTHILQKELGLTMEQIRDIGREAIPAKVAIDALIRGWQRSSEEGGFAGAAAEVEQGTLKGLMTTASDYAMFITSDVFKGIFDAWKGLMKNMLVTLTDLRAGMQKVGLVYLFEHIVPPQLRTTIKVIIGSLQSLWTSIKMLGTALKPLAGAFMEYLVRALGMVIPAIAGVVRVIALLVVWATKSSGVVRALVGVVLGLLICGVVAAQVALLVAAVKALGIAKVVASAVTLLRNAILALNAALVANKVTALIMLLAAVFIGLALSIKSVSDWLDRVMKQLSALFGLQLDNIFKPLDPEDLSDALSGLGDGFEDLLDDAEDTGKAIKDTFIASFDEVYPVKEALGDVGKGFGDLWPDTDLDLPDYSDDLPDLIPDDGILEKAKRKWGDFFATIPWNLPKIDWGALLPPTAIVTGLPAFAFAWASAWARIKLAAYNAIDWVKQLLNGLVTSFPRILPGILTGLAGIGIGIGTWIGQSLQGLRRWANDATQPVKDWVTNTLERARQWGWGFREAVSLGLAGALVAVAAFPSKAWEWLKRGLNNMLEGIKIWGGNLATFFTDNKGIILGIVGALVISLILLFAGIPAGVTTALAGFAVMVGGIFGKAKTVAAAETEETKQNTINKYEEMRKRITEITTVMGDWLKTKWESIKITLSDIWEGVKTTAKNKWDAVTTVIKGAINGITAMINTFIRYWNRLKLDVPAVDIPMVGQVGGFSIGFPKMNEIPRLQRGGIVPHDMIVRAGEKNKEAIVPLTGTEARPFAKVIAEEMAGVMSGSTQDTGERLPILYVHTLIADDKGIKELYRKFRVIELEENVRIGGA